MAEGGGGEQTIVFEVPGELRGRVKKDSVLMAVNNMPVSGRKDRKSSDLAGLCSAL